MSNREPSLEHQWTEPAGERPWGPVRAAAPTAARFPSRVDGGAPPRSPPLQGVRRLPGLTSSSQERSSCGPRWGGAGRSVTTLQKAGDTRAWPREGHGPAAEPQHIPAQVAAKPLEMGRETFASTGGAGADSSREPRVWASEQGGLARKDKDGPGLPDGAFRLPAWSPDRCRHRQVWVLLGSTPQARPVGTAPPSSPPAQTGVHGALVVTASFPRLSFLLRHPLPQWDKEG